MKNSENLGNYFVLLQSNNLLENTLEGECDRDTHKFLEKNVEENLIKTRIFFWIKNNKWYAFCQLVTFSANNLSFEKRTAPLSFELLSNVTLVFASGLDGLKNMIQS